MMVRLDQTESVAAATLSLSYLFSIKVFDLAITILSFQDVLKLGIKTTLMSS